jgi:Conjugal transfer protein TraD
VDLTGDDRAIILGALLWMADKLKSNEGEQARALWAVKGKEAFAVERATDGPTMSQETLQDRSAWRRPEKATVQHPRPLRRSSSAIAVQGQCQSGCHP